MITSSPSIGFDLPLHLAEDVFLEDTDTGEMVALNAKSEEAYHFTPTAALLFKQLMVCEKIEDIIANVQRSVVGADATQIGTDIQYLTNELVQAGIIEIDLGNDFEKR